MGEPLMSGKVEYSIMTYTGSGIWFDIDHHIIYSDTCLRRRRIRHVWSINRYRNVFTILILKNQEVNNV